MQVAIMFSGSGDLRIAERSGSPSGVFIALALFTWAITAVAVAPRRRPASDSRAFVVRVSPVFSAAMNVLRLDIGGIAAPPYSYILVHPACTPGRFPLAPGGAWAVTYSGHEQSYSRVVSSIRDK